MDIYVSMDTSGISYEWEDFNEMIEYYQSYPLDRWCWTKKKVR